MKHIHNGAGLFRGYLLGLLEEDEQRQLEEQILSDPKYFEELLVAEDELIDDYIDSALSAGERKNFERHFLATLERKRKLNFARALKRHVTVAEVAQSAHASYKSQSLVSWSRFIPASLRARSPAFVLSLAAVLIITLVGSWLIVKNLKLHNGVGQGAGSNTIAVNLSSGVLRGAGEIKRVVITPDVSTVQLHLELVRDEYQSYRAVVQTDEGAEAFVADKLKPETVGMGRAVTFDTPARLLSSGDFHVTLSGVTAGGELEDVSKYHFRVATAASKPQ